MLRGKGLWAYRDQEIDRAIEIAPRMGATHIIFKVAHGSLYFARSRQVAQEIRTAGLVPFGWTFLLLDDPQAEAQVVVRALQDGFQGFVFDTESDRCRGRFTEAAQLGQYLQLAGVDSNSLYNCSFPNISHHRELPYDQMNRFCKGGLMPMAYGTFFPSTSTVPPEQQARRVIDEWTYGHWAYWCRRWQQCPPVYPVLGPYRDEEGEERMDPSEFQVWLDRLASYSPSFFSIFTAAVLGDDLLPLIRSFPLGDGLPSVIIALAVEVVSPEVGYLNVRPLPSTVRPPITRVDHGEVLEALEAETAVRAKAGRQGEWLHIRTPSGVEGYVAAWYVRLHDEIIEEEIQVEVLSPIVGYLNVRPSPSTVRPPITQVGDGAVLDSLEPEEDTRAKIGRKNQWLHVRTPESIEGYVAAWYLGLYRRPTATGEPIPYVSVRSAQGLNVRKGPGVDPPIWRVVDGTVLEVREDPKRVAEKIGKDRWIKVRTPSLHDGSVNGLYVRAEQVADRRKPVDDATLPRGQCAWIFGIHGATADTTGDFRHLFAGKNKTGWVLFTEAVGTDPFHSSGHDVTRWSDSGYGMIIRLNHGYEPAGTLPVRAKYGEFAGACARYVSNSRGCHIWIIGNEQNNVREHPGGAANPIEHITPRDYAEAFNLAWRRIKGVQPNAIVVPGAIDPYNTFPWARLGGRRNRPLEYFKEMLDHIVELDGIALHTYTHWLDASLITKPTVFQDDFLQPGTSKEHYYDFQAYRPFAEAIPAKWRDRPIYITETNHWLALEHQPHNPSEERRIGWLNQDKGWVQAAYKEIHRWNSTPHAQQIHCLLLYRWTGDQWAIEHRGEIHKDFRQALNADYRWRR
jgi:hypothetical protein